MSTNELALKAHLFRRAGFGASRNELDEIDKKDYESIVDDFLSPERFEEEIAPVMRNPILLTT